MSSFSTRREKPCLNLFEHPSAPAWPRFDAALSETSQSFALKEKSQSSSSDQPRLFRIQRRTEKDKHSRSHWFLHAPLRHYGRLFTPNLHLNMGNVLHSAWGECKKGEQVMWKTNSVPGWSSCPWTPTSSPQAAEMLSLHPAHNLPKHSTSPPPPSAAAGTNWSLSAQKHTEAGTGWLRSGITNLHHFSDCRGLKSRHKNYVSSSFALLCISICNFL